MSIFKPNGGVFRERLFHFPRHAKTRGGRELLSLVLRTVESAWDVADAVDGGMPDEDVLEACWRAVRSLESVMAQYPEKECRKARARVKLASVVGSGCPVGSVWDVCQHGASGRGEPTR